MPKEIIDCSPTDKRTGCFTRIANSTENDQTWADLRAAQVFYNLPDLLPVDDSEDTRPIVALERNYATFRQELDRNGPEKMARLLTEPKEHDGTHGTDYEHTRGHEDRLVTERMKTLFGVEPDYLLLYGTDDETEPQDGSVVLHTSALMPKPAEKRSDEREPLIVSLGDISRFAQESGATMEINPDLAPNSAGLSFVVRGVTPEELKAAEDGGIPIELHEKRDYVIKRMQRELAQRAERAAIEEAAAREAEQLDEEERAA